MLTENRLAQSLVHERDLVGIGLPDSMVKNGMLRWRQAVPGTCCGLVVYGAPLPILLYFPISTKIGLNFSRKKFIK